MAVLVHILSESDGYIHLCKFYQLEPLLVIHKKKNRFLS